MNLAVSDYRALARRRLPHMLFEYLDGGATEEKTLHRNSADFDKLSLRFRVMRDMREVDTRTEIFGQSFSAPLGLSPVGLAGMYARRGEVQAARAAAMADVPFCLSSMGICDVDEVAKGAPPPWFQLYVLKDRGHTREIIARARAARCPAMMLTVDSALPGVRYRDSRSGFSDRKFLRTMMDGLAHPAWMFDVWLKGRPHMLGTMANALGGQAAANLANLIERNLSWNDLEWIQKEWGGPFIIKGIFDQDDARLAVRAGCQGIMVSNHGGRQLDGIDSSIMALRRVVDAVGDEVPIFMDGGVRSGVDILKAMAVGARACFIGRPWAYALAAGGQSAVFQMLETLRTEFTVALGLSGCTSVADVSRNLLEQS